MKHKSLNFQSLLLATLCLIFTISFTACSSDDDEPSDPIVGTWLLQINEGNEVWNLQFHFMSNGALEGKSWETPSKSEPKNYEFTGKWSTSGEFLSITFIEDGESDTETYRYSVTDNKLIIFDYEEDGPNTFFKR